MIDREHALSITRQAEVPGISRGSAYYLPRPVSERDLKLMRRIDELHLELPFAGARMLRDLLRAEGVKVGRKHVRTLMEKMGIEALYRAEVRGLTVSHVQGHGGELEKVAAAARTKAAADVVIDSVASLEATLFAA